MVAEAAAGGFHSLPLQVSLRPRKLLHVCLFLAPWNSNGRRIISSNTCVLLAIRSTSRRLIFAASAGLKWICHIHTDALQSLKRSRLKAVTGLGGKKVIIMGI